MASAKSDWDATQTSVIAMADRQRVGALDALEVKHREAVDRVLRQVI